MCQVSGQAARKRVESMKKLDVTVEEDREVPEESLRHFFKAIECLRSVHSVVEESARQ